MADWLGRVVPALHWIRHYDKRWFAGDVSAGLTVAVMLIPQGMAYALLAGLPPHVGLYASVAPLVIYALFSSSRHLAVGPAAMVSLLVTTGVGALAQPGSDTYIAYAVLIALLVGVIQLAMATLRLGFLVNFLSRPVMSGFTSAAALIIFFGQLGQLLGIALPRGHHVHAIVYRAALQITAINLPTLLIGTGSIVALAALKRYWPRFPRALAVVVLSTLLVWLLKLDTAGAAVVGAVPAGLPLPALPRIDADAVVALLRSAGLIALIGFLQSIPVAKEAARRHRYDLDANQELVGLGMANLAAAFFVAFPVAGGLSRTAVNDQAGARTPLASLITAAVTALAVSFLAPLLYFIPKAALAAIIMVAVLGLVDVSEVQTLWRIKKSDLALLVVTFVATLALGIERGIGIGVGASLLWFVVRTTRPHTAVLGRLPGTAFVRNIRNFPEAEQVPGVLALRVDAQLYFGNVSFLKDTLRRLEAERGSLAAVVIDASGMNNLDSSAASALLEIAQDYHERGIELALSGVKRPVYRVMERAGLVEILGERRFFLGTYEAMLAMKKEVQ